MDEHKGRQRPENQLWNRQQQRPPVRHATRLTQRSNHCPERGHNRHRERERKAEEAEERGVEVRDDARRDQGDEITSRRRCDGAVRMTASMSEERPHLQRYKDRRAHDAIALGPFPFMALIASIGLIVHAAFAGEVRVALVAAVSGVAVLLLGFGIRQAKDWARLALVVLFSLGIAVNLAQLFVETLQVVDVWDALFYSFMGWLFLTDFTGTEAKERFARARRFLARRDLERAEACALIISGARVDGKGAD